MSLPLRFLGDASGATAIEYGFVALLVSIAAVGAFVALGSSVENLFQRATLGW